MVMQKIDYAVQFANPPELDLESEEVKKTCRGRRLHLCGGTDIVNATSRSAP